MTKLALLVLYIIFLTAGTDAFNRRVNDLQLMRVKRQLIPWNACRNGGQRLGYGCYYNFQCTTIYAQSECVDNCCCTKLTPQPPQPPEQSWGYCSPNGKQSIVRCSAKGQCGATETCMNGLCCPKSQDESYYACGGDAARSECSWDSCNQGLACVPSNYCCKCPVGMDGGSCGNGQLCPTGYTCHANGYCCATCPGGQTPVGVCLRNMCGYGRTCMPGNICC
uniref:CC domain-containing protein n=1 Tax=Steinernema glaseri TaxID=37863 RepID=A0A1I8AUF3_9BILA